MQDLTAFAERAGNQMLATFVETATGADNSRPEQSTQGTVT
jgi:hypothetical protein